MRSANRAERLRQFEALCRAKGVPLTVQRRAIFEAVLERDDHPAADEIYEVVKERMPGLSRTTVYRVLDTLVGLGAIRRVPHAGSVARFDGKTHRHHHLVCSRCGKIVDWESPELDRLPLPKGRPRGFQIEDYTVQFTGTCGECRRGKQ